MGDPRTNPAEDDPLEEAAAEAEQRRRLVFAHLGRFSAADLRMAAEAAAQAAVSAALAAERRDTLRMEQEIRHSLDEDRRQFLGPAGSDTSTPGAQGVDREERAHRALTVLAEGEAGAVEEALVPVLSALSDSVLALEAWQRDEAQPPPRIADGAREALRDLEEVLAPFRARLDRRPLAVQVRRRLAGSAAVVRSTGLPGHLPGLASAAIVEIAAEAVANARQHGRDPHPEVVLAGGPGSVTLVVHDTGPGFDVAAAERRTDAVSGLPRMHAWAVAAQGALRLRSAAGEGTEVRFRVPLAQGHRQGPGQR